MAEGGDVYFPLLSLLTLDVHIAGIRYQTILSFFVLFLSPHRPLILTSKIRNPTKKSANIGNLPERSDLDTIHLKGTYRT
jgi:hypothetical protein